MMKTPFMYRMHLQHFGGEFIDAGSSTQSEPQSQAPSEPVVDPQQAQEHQYNPFDPETYKPKSKFFSGPYEQRQAELKAQQQANVQVQSQETTPQPQKFNFAGREIEVTDPKIAEILGVVQGDYAKLQGFATQTSQKAKEYESELNRLRAEQTNVQQTKQSQPPQQEQPQTPPFDPETFMDKFYENPYETMKMFMESMVNEKLDKEVKPVIQPIQEINQNIEQQNKLRSQVESVIETYGPEIENYAPQIQEFFNQNPTALQREDAIEYAYLRVKASQPMPQQIDPAQLAQDPQFLNQYVYNNPEIKNQFINQHVEELNNRQAPPVINSSNGGFAPFSPEQRPKTMKEASKMYRAWNRQNGQ